MRFCMNTKRIYDLRPIFTERNSLKYKPTIGSPPEKKLLTSKKRARTTTPSNKRLCSRVRMILESLDCAILTGKTKKVEMIERLTIEHLLPQEWGLYWPVTEGIDAELRNSFISV